MRIIFAAPGLGKSYYIKNVNKTWIDCDSIIEYVMGETVNELVKNEVVWDYCKNQIINWWKEYFSEKNLIVGKDRWISECEAVYLHTSAEMMSMRIASSDRENPITDWDCKAKEYNYIQSALKYNKPIIRIEYLSDILQHLCS